MSGWSGFQAGRWLATCNSCGLLLTGPRSIMLERPRVSTPTSRAPAHVTLLPVPLLLSLRRPSACHPHFIHLPRRPRDLILRIRKHFRQRHHRIFRLRFRQPVRLHVLRDPHIPASILQPVMLAHKRSSRRRHPLFTTSSARCFTSAAFLCCCAFPLTMPVIESSIGGCPACCTPATPSTPFLPFASRLLLPSSFPAGTRHPLRRPFFALPLT
jgi:hypothetical protein